MTFAGESSNHGQVLCRWTTMSGCVVSVCRLPFVTNPLSTLGCAQDRCRGLTGYWSTLGEPQCASAPDWLLTVAFRRPTSAAAGS
jgi:hypothetical protein